MVYKQIVHVKVPKGMEYLKLKIKMSSKKYPDNLTYFP